jgi:hypothetical protein
MQQTGNLVLLSYLDPNEFNTKNGLRSGLFGAIFSHLWFIYINTSQQIHVFYII